LLMFLFMIYNATPHVLPLLLLREDTETP